MRLFGIETEYGITSVGHDPERPPSSIELADRVIRAYRDVAPQTAGWDYSTESPLADAWGMIHSRSGAHPDLLTDQPGYANRVLGNGARFYVDHAHPEYSGPEVTTLADLVAYDLAGDEIMRRAAAAASQTAGYAIRLYKNNTDGKGASYGCHENYLLARALPFADLVAQVTPFLVARSVLVGAGRVGLGQGSERPGFQLAQRPDFFEAEVGLETTIRRPLVNTRDEPHADPRHWRRLHVITGDANRQPFQTWLKVGTLALVLAMIEAGWRDAPALADPVAAFGTISHDPGLRVTVPLQDGRQVTALDLVEHYRDACVAFAVDHPEVLGEETTSLLDAWSDTLTTLRETPMRLVDRLDWVAKLVLIEQVRCRDDLAWDAPKLAALDLQYAELDPSRSLFDTLARRGLTRPVVDAAAIERAVEHPPETTRAYLRGEVLRRFGGQVLAVGWDSLTLQLRGGRLHNLRMLDPFAHTRADLGPTFETARTLDDLVAMGTIDHRSRG